MNKDPRVYQFSTSGLAYDASQVMDHVRDGDVLSVPDEMAVAILVGAWPVAISEAVGQFHTLDGNHSWAALPSLDGLSVLDYTASVKVARKEINRLQYEARKGK